MSLLNFAMSTATRNSAQTFSYLIPPNSVEDHHSSLSHCYRTMLMADYTSFLSLFSNKTLAVTVTMQIPH